MEGTYLLLIVNTNTCWKTELHWTILLSCTVFYIWHSMALPAGSMFQGQHTVAPSINSLLVLTQFLGMVWVPLSPCSLEEHFNFKGTHTFSKKTR